MAFAMFDAIFTAYMSGRLTADQANAWLAAAGFNLTVGVE